MKITIALLTTLAIMSFKTVVADKPKGEFFLAAPPKGWTLADKDTQLHIANFRFVPAGESTQQWSQMVTITKMTGESMLPDKYLNQAAEQKAINCTDYQNQRLPFKGANGYPTDGIIELCGNNKTSSKGELTVIRTIKGTDHLFAIQKTWRLQPFDLSKGLPIPKQEIDETVLYFAGTKVCDTRRGTCPANMGK